MNGFFANTKLFQVGLDKGMPNRLRLQTELHCQRGHAHKISCRPKVEDYSPACLSKNMIQSEGICKGL